MSAGPAVDHLRLEGAIFLRGEYTEAWAYESPTGEMMASVLRPGTERLDPPPWTQMPVVRHGSGGARTDVICGYLDVDDPLFDPALAALPSIFVVRPTGAAAPWVQSSLQYVLAATEGGDTGSQVLTQLPTIVVAEVLRLHIASAPAGEHGWLAALRDPVLAPALSAIHSTPERKWTVAELAAHAHVSRSVLDERFRKMLGRSPIRYLTDWRLHVAKDLLATTDLSVHAVAHRVGYESEEAFSRAFKRAHGRAPSHWRGSGADG